MLRPRLRPWCFCFNIAVVSFAIKMPYFFHSLTRKQIRINFIFVYKIWTLWFFCRAPLKICIARREWRFRKWFNLLNWRLGKPFSKTIQGTVKRQRNPAIKGFTKVLNWHFRMRSQFQNPSVILRVASSQSLIKLSNPAILYESPYSTFRQSLGPHTLFNQSGKFKSSFRYNSLLHSRNYRIDR